MGKIIVIFFLLTTYNLQSQVVMDSVIIYDYASANRSLRKSGVEPIHIKIDGLDTLVLDATYKLDANYKKNRNRRSISYARNFIVPTPHYLSGVKIYFPKDSMVGIHVKAANTFGTITFNLDTLLIINNATPRPLFFWAMLRQPYQSFIGFHPNQFTLTNEDFTAKNLPKYVIKNIPPRFIRYVCNTVTKELVDLWAVEEKPK